MQDYDYQDEQSLRKYKALLNRISYTSTSEDNKKYNYLTDSIAPFVQFWKLLALKPCDKKHKNKLILNVPDTIVFNDGDNPIMWFYTNQNGEVNRIDNVPYNQITDKLSQGALEKQLVAVLKKPSYGFNGICGNQIKLISASEMKTVLSLILSNRSDASVIQKFVKSYSVKPSVVRTVWRLNGPIESWILSSNYQYRSQAKVPQISKFIVNTKNQKAFNAIKSSSQKYTKQTLAYLQNIVNFVGKHLNIRFLEFVGDFVKDQGGNWWFINAKAFIINTDQKISPKPISNHDDDPNIDKEKKKLQTYTKCKKCKYCYKVVADHLLTHTLTLMMILQCDQNLIKMGKDFQWLQRCYSQHVGTVNLYIQYKVCDSCYKLYKEIQKLVALQTKMAKLTGIPILVDNKNVVSITSVPAFKGYPPQFGSRLQKIKYETDMPSGWALPTDQPLQISLINDKMKSVSKCRFMIFIHGIRDIPKKVLGNNKKYTVQYNWLNHTGKHRISFKQFKISTQSEELIHVSLNKIKIIYFFAESRAHIKEFIKNIKSMEIRLLQNDEVYGSVQLQLEQFKSDKVLKRDYFKMFSGKKIFPYLSWGLHISLGLQQGDKIEASRLKLQKKNQLFFPQSDYHSPDPLPQQWIQMIQQKQSKKQSQKLPSQGSTEQRATAMNRTINSKSELSQKQIMQRQINSYRKRKTNSQYKNRKPYY